MSAVRDRSGPRSSYLNDAATDRCCDCLRAIFRAQLVHDVAKVGLDGVFRDQQYRTDVAVAVALGHAPQNLHLPFAQRRSVQVRGKCFCNSSWHMLESRMHLPDDSDEFFMRAAFEQVATRATGERALNLHVAFRRRQHNDARRWVIGANRGDCCNATHVRKPQIHEGEVRHVLAELRYGFGCGRGRRYQLHVSTLGDDRRDSFAEQRMIIHAENAQALRLMHDSTPMTISSRGSPTRLRRMIRPGLLTLLLGACGTAFALNSTLSITQLGHKAWRVQDGFFKSAPRAIAQTKDGYIWVATQSELLRFDGVRFVPWQSPRGNALPSTSITALHGARDGSLWIGTQAGLARWTGLELEIVAGQSGAVTNFYEDAAGALWFTNSDTRFITGALCQVVGKSSRCFRRTSGDRASGTAIVGGADGSILAGTSAGVLRWKNGVIDELTPPGTDQYLGGVVALAQASTGELWIAQAAGLGLRRFVGGEWKPFRVAGFDGSTLTPNALYFDGAQSLWVGVSGEGIVRIRGDTVERFSVNDGLPGNMVSQFMEDREGTLWAVTSGGLHSFRDLRVATFSMREGLALSEVDTVLAGRDGTLWIGGDGSLDALRGGRITSLRRADGLPGNQVTSLLEDRRGWLWVGIEYGLTLYRDGRFHAVLMPDGKPTGLIVGLAEDVNGVIWAEASGTPRKLLRIEGLTVVAEYATPALPAARRIAADPAGGLWLGLLDGNIARFRDGRLETFTYREGGDASFDTSITQIDVSPDGRVLAASFSGGLLGWNAGTQRTLTRRNGLPCDGVNGFVTDLRGDLWLSMQCGLVEISRAELELWWRTPDARVSPRILDSADGAQPGVTPFVAAARTPDGRLWFVNGAALQMVDPARLGRNEVPPAVHIETIVADRKVFPPRDSLRLAPRTRDIEIEYGAPSFVAPQKMRFRYRLEGHDTRWQEPGTRRVALYNDLKPGDYSFNVIASNNDGLWNEKGATLRFGVAPAWYQTTVFRLLLIAVAALLLWMVHRIRMWQVAKALNARFDERLAERMRLAREFHDTVLQTVQACKLISDSALVAATEPIHIRQSLERLSSWLGTAISEGRAALSSLRASTTQRNDLAAALRAAAENCTHDSEVSMTVTGEVQEMHPIVRDEISRIGCEAIRNALCHSGGSRIQIELDYASDLRLRVKDNGSGIPAAVLQSGTAGHFGLHGMRERAANIGSVLNFVTAPGGGTAIELVVPGNVIYDRTSRATA